jgi:dipeptidyl-peptidase-4
MDGRQIAALYRRTKKTHKASSGVPEVVRLKAVDGTPLYGLLQKPLDYIEGRKYPVIVKVYGGPQAQSVRNAWHDPDMDAVYTSNGYVVWALDNRGSTGRGHAFEEPVYHNLGAIEVADQRTGVEYLIKQGIADPKRIGITGWSYGGYMTIRCLLLAPDLFKAGAAGAPVTDWHNYDTIYTERYMGLPSQDATGYATSSNVASAAKLAGKLLIQHNLEDDNVLFQNTMQFVNALEQANKQYALQLYPLRTHGVTGDLRRPLYIAQLDFFNRNLQ